MKLGNKFSGAGFISSSPFTSDLNALNQQRATKCMKKILQCPVPKTGFCVNCCLHSKVFFGTKISIYALKEVEKIK